MIEPRGPFEYKSEIPTQNPIDLPLPLPDLRKDESWPVLNALLESSYKVVLERDSMTKLTGAFLLKNARRVLEIIKKDPPLLLTPYASALEILKKWKVRPLTRAFYDRGVPDQKDPNKELVPLLLGLIHLLEERQPGLALASFLCPDEGMLPLEYGLRNAKDIPALLHVMAWMGNSLTSFRLSSPEPLPKETLAGLLHACIVKGNPILFNAVISWRPDVNARDKDGQPLIAVAISVGREAFVKALLEKGASPNARTKAGSSLLRLAVLEKQVGIVHILLDHGANPNDERMPDGSLLDSHPLLIDAMKMRAAAAEAEKTERAREERAKESRAKQERARNRYLAAPSEIREFPLSVFLWHVAKGGQQEVEEMLLDEDKGFLFQEGVIPDNKQSCFVGVKAIEYCKWALDLDMLKMLIKHWPREKVVELAKQILAEDRYKIGLLHSKKLEDLTSYIDEFSKLELYSRYDERDYIWGWITSELGFFRRNPPEKYPLNELGEKLKIVLGELKELKKVGLEEMKKFELWANKVLDPSRSDDVTPHWDALRQLGCAFEFEKEKSEFTPLASMPRLPADLQRYIYSFFCEKWTYKRQNNKLQSSSDAFFPPTRMGMLPFFGDYNLYRFCELVAQRESDIVENMLRMNSRLALGVPEAGIEDLQGRTFYHMTAFQNRLWALDSHFYTKINKYLSREDAMAQAIYLLENGTKHGFTAVTLMLNLIQAYDHFIDVALNVQGVEACQKALSDVDRAQRLVPATKIILMDIEGYEPVFVKEAKANRDAVKKWITVHVGQFIKFLKELDVEPYLIQKALEGLPPAYLPKDFCVEGRQREIQFCVVS